MQIDQIIRSKRKTVAILVTAEGRVVIRAPLRFPAREIERIVVEKEQWIREKQLEVENKRLLHPVHLYQEGELFTYLGMQYPLTFDNQVRPEVSLRKNIFVVSKSVNGRLPDVFERWYRKQAKDVFTERVTLYSTLLTLPVKKIRISGAKTRWGSCSSRGTISLTWRLLMAPIEIVDYVVLHEIVHLAHLNHSKAFWETLRQWMPDYPRRKKWLKDYGAQLKL